MAGKRLACSKYRELARKQLRKLFGELFTEFTGLHFHITWTQTATSDWNARPLPTDCSHSCRLSGAPRSKECQSCRPKQIARALGTNGNSHHFTCGHGVRNYWLPIRLRGETFGLAYLQARAHSASRFRARKRLPRRLHPPPHREDAKAMGRLKFEQAVRLLHLFVQHLQTSSLADLQQEELANVQRALRVFKNDQKRLRKKLHGLMPAFREELPVAQLESRPEQLAHAVLDRIHHDYARPLTLRQCAGDLRVNPAYLSYLFSCSVGLPFKTCLTEIRIEKARELLSDPARSISEVASDVGYASENRFRIAFKRVTGYPPRVWRETLQVNQQPSPAAS
jgi:AraC-like DNA-binding protein